MKLIRISGVKHSDKCAIVDDDDYPCLSRFKWYLARGYVRRNVSDGTHRTVVYMHQAILHTPPGKVTDHKNRNPLDNRRCNLRIATHSQNHANLIGYANNTSGHKGVVWHRASHLWHARIWVNQRRISLRYSKNKDVAIKRYEEAARLYYGSFAN